MRLIDADKLHYVKMLVQNPNNGKHKHLVAVRAEEINKAPAVDAQPIIHARWLGFEQVAPGEWAEHEVKLDERGRATESCRCSNCREWLVGSDEYDCNGRYCPNCGAKMDLKEVEDVEVQGSRHFGRIGS